MRRVFLTNFVAVSFPDSVGEVSLSSSGSVSARPAADICTHHPLHHSLLTPLVVGQSDTDSGRSSLASADSHSNGSWVGGDGCHGNLSPVVAMTVRNNNVQRTDAVSSLPLHHLTALSK